MYLNIFSKPTGNLPALFPQTTVGVFYTQPVSWKKSATGKAIPARGKLPDTIRNVLYLAGICKKRKKDEPEPSIVEKRTTLEQLKSKKFNRIIY